MGGIHAAGKILLNKKYQIEDINRALDNHCYFSALSLALTLPDICAKAEYPDIKNNKERYIKWYDEYIGQYEKVPKTDLEKTSMPYLSGEVVYQLRCAFLHQGTPTIDMQKIQEKRNKITEFELIIGGKKEDFGHNADHAMVEIIGNNEEIRKYSVHVRRFCFIVCANAEAFYKKEKEKFNFFHFSILDENSR